MKLNRFLTLNGSVCGVLVYSERNKYTSIPTLENFDYLIPDGNYNLKLQKVGAVYTRYSQKSQFCSENVARFFKENGIPLLLNVPSRSGILMHSGNVRMQSKGCILVGSGILHCPNISLIGSIDALISLIAYIARSKDDVIKIKTFVDIDEMSQ